jgi:CarD family transcriptional regulator
MHNVGEKIMYGASGLMEIVDIREETVTDAPRIYYVLRELHSSSTSETYVPVDNKRLVESMRPLLTKGEIEELLSKVRENRISDVEWHNDNRKRSEQFKKIIESGDREAILSMIRAVYENGVKRQQEGKKNYLTDENIMHKAERLIAIEFSEVLSIPEEEVSEYIKKHVEG